MSVNKSAADRGGAPSRKGVTTTAPPPKEARLPKWAQDELRRLRANAEWLEARHGGGTGRIVLDPYGTAKRYSEEVRIHIEDGDGDQFQISVDGKAIRVMMCGRMKSRLIVHPEAANVVRLSGAE